MAITKEQAVNLRYRDELHYGECIKHVGPRGGVRVTQETWRVNGKCQTWKTRPTEFTVPIKFGLKSCSYLTDRNAGEFHLARECPLLEPAGEGHEKHNDQDQDGERCV